MACPQLPAQPFRCPTEDELLPQTLALLPRGRAWQTDDGGPRPGTVLYKWWAAYNAVLAYLYQRLCALRLEFWCQTHSETHAEWMADYGLPDPCDPFPDLCAKVAAIGGTRCEYYADIARRAGWSIECSEFFNVCSAPAGCSYAGCTIVGFSRSINILITVHLPDSPAFTGRVHSLPYAGCFRAGQMLACLPSIEPLKCILERVVHAHVQIVYHLIGIP